MLLSPDRDRDPKFDTRFTIFAELKPRADWVLRHELQNIGQRGVLRTRGVYVGSQAVGARASTDLRELDYGEAVFWRLRKAFG